MTDTEAAWLGAMVDAEGTISALANGRWRVGFVNTEVEYISVFLRLTGLGTVSSTQRERGFRVWLWTINRTLEVSKFCQRIAPWSLKARRVPALAQKERRVVGLSNRKKTHCPAGHPYDEANTYNYVRKSGQKMRMCRTCQHK